MAGAGDYLRYWTDSDADAANSKATARVIGRPFPPGQSGNPNGRPRDQFSFMGILRSALAEENRSGKSVGERIIARYIKLALAGNGQALEALVARIDGKPAQSLTLKGDSDAPLHVRHSARLEAPAPSPKLPALDENADATSPTGPVLYTLPSPQEVLDDPALPAPEQEQEAVGDIPADGMVHRIDGKVVRDPDHPAPDVAE